MKAWLEHLERARSGEEILAGARDYCCLLSPRDLALLPEECRRIRLDAAADIAPISRKLSASVAQLRDPHGAEARRLQELVRFLSRAEERLGELRD